MTNATTLLTIKVPCGVRELLVQSAKQNKRRVQDEFIKRLNASFEHLDMLNLLRGVLKPRMVKIYHQKNV